MATGDIKVRYDNSLINGFVRCNALTIGNAVSGATERANADTQTLWIYLYAKDPNLVVSGGRTGNALNDYNAGKQLTMPDWRGRTIAGLADMGNSATTALTATGFGNVVTTLGAAGGAQVSVILAANLPPHTHSGTTNIENTTHTHAFQHGFINNGSTSLIEVLVPIGTGTGADSSTTESANHVHSFTTDNGPGSSSPFPTVPPMMLATIYMKL
jgi:hypothetical protein